MSFELKSGFTPQGDQPRAIKELVEGLRRKDKHQTLLGVTGSGKTFTLANVVAQVQRPTLVIAHNKLLAAQLYGEFKDLFPTSAVHYFVSYYDYYQPEAYVPSTDTFIEKDSSINDEIDRMRHAATHALLTRNDVLIVASVSCIYGLGTSESYFGMKISLGVGQEFAREKLLANLVEIQYQRNDLDFHRGTFRARGDTVEIFPAYEESRAIRVEFFGDTIERLTEFDPLRGRTLATLDKATVFPGSHYVTGPERRQEAMTGIRAELRERLTQLHAGNKLLEAQRLEQRTLFDLEMIEQMGFCSGIENYSRHLSGRRSGEPPPTLIDYFPKDFLLAIDESHQTIPQIGAMFRGDQSRKQTLVEFGFRLPSALDNRPLRFEEFERMVGQGIYISATPSEYEIQKSNGVVVEQIIRPTGLVDPAVEVRPALSQVDDLLSEIRLRTAKGERTLVTTLTKRMAEDLTEYYAELGVRVRYLHSDIETLERADLIRDLRRGGFDVLVGINLLREGLDIPEVSLIGIMDADKEGFLRSAVALIQTIGRAARNLHGRVILYADTMTASMKRAISETDRRRAIQTEYNRIHGITPQSVQRAILDLSEAAASGISDYLEGAPGGGASPASLGGGGGWGPLSSAGPMMAAEAAGLVPSAEEIPKLVAELRKQMKDAAGDLDFERAAELRDRIKALQDVELGLPLSLSVRSLTAAKAGAGIAGGAEKSKRGGEAGRRRTRR